MQKNNNSIMRLRLLVWLTAIILLGIIGLQVYWLVTSYKQQKSRFSADVENALMAASVKLTLAQSGLNLPDSPAGDVPDVISMSLGEAPDKTMMTHGGGHVTIHMDDSLRKRLFHNSSAAQTQSLLNDLLAGGSAGFTPDEKFTRYKKMLNTEFIKRSIQSPYQLAVIDRNGHYTMATCDTTVFKNIPLKYTGQPGFLSQGGTLQVAFLNANVYLLKRMAWLLCITLLLITLGGLAFSYLIVLFFRQKKFADIRNDFLNNMTHELKTPISTVSVAIELMQDNRRPLDEIKKQEFLSIAQGELKRLTMLVEKVLKMAAFEKSEITLSAEKFNASQWLHDVLLACKPLFEANHAEAEALVKPDSFVLFADKTHMTNVLQNLLENAIKYNDKKQPKITVTLQQSDTFFELTVHDNGKGIPAAYIEKVFDQFFRIPSGDLHNTKGYGLGLSYVKAIVELHGGVVSVQSKEHEGSTFIIRLPELKL